NVMVDLLEKYEDTGTPFNMMVCEAPVARVEPPVARAEPPVVDVSDLKEKIRLYALSHNPHCDVDNMPDDVVLMMYKDMMGQ
ncbi:hypothetical protein MJM96_23890, partial [Salmonella enterica subsp. enterica serovar Anatum]|nr:hypothetical protein [Salmonella enterica subsp. enterica serovar Anatum]